MSIAEAAPIELAVDALESDISQAETQPEPVRFQEVALSALSNVARQAQNRLLAPLERTAAKLRKAHQARELADVIGDALRPAHHKL